MKKLNRPALRSKPGLPVLLILLALLMGVACRSGGIASAPAVSTGALPGEQGGAGPPKHPDWSHNVSIYEVNVRQYSTSGTFKDFEQHLPRLKEMGVGILWFMPIHPIGARNRKGSLGSYYSVRDYYGVNPEFGTVADFKALVRRIHEMGMYVIIDWVANHTAWDNDLTEEHRDWYIRDARGDFIPPVADWSDVIDLNYDRTGLWDYMIGAMKFWVEEVDVDGFRCDVAGMVPIEFWNRARRELDQIKPVFMLAEWESSQMHERAFDMTYGWNLYKLMNRIAEGTSPAADLGMYLAREAITYPTDAYRMYFTSNHDENSWNGTVFERLGDGAGTFAVLAATIGGMPLVYSGQEAGLNKRLKFFDKDVIEWKEHGFAGLYTTLLNLKKVNRALWNGKHGGEVEWIHTSNDGAVFAFVRVEEDDKVFVILNLSAIEQDIGLSGSSYVGDYKDVFGGGSVSFAENTTVTLRPWEYRVYARNVSSLDSQKRKESQREGE